MKSTRALIRIAGLSLALSATGAHAQVEDEQMQENRAEDATGTELDIFGDETITGMTGAEVYDNVCAGCHMPDGEGVVGAGTYPALADNPRMEFADYPIYIVVRGQKGMPSLGEFLTDEQVVAVVEYLQTDLNDYGPDATLEAVAAARPQTEDNRSTEEHE